MSDAEDDADDTGDNSSELGGDGAETDNDAVSFSNAHQLQGGAITRDVYRWVEHQDRRQQRLRSMSISDLASLRSAQGDDSATESVARLREPGAFRRHFVAQRAAERGQQQPNFLTRNFIDFLALYGHFAGDNFPSDDDDDDDEDLLAADTVKAASATSALGTASVGKVFFLLIKSFIGTGVLFLPRAFYNGGLLFSAIVLCLVSALCLHAMLLLVECRRVVPGSFGDIGGALYGPVARYAVLFSIVISQLGFSCAYTIFVAKNIRDLAMLVSDCRWIIPEKYLIIGQLAVYIPMAMVRKIKHLSNAALVADLFIVFGLVYLYYYDISVLVTVGMARVQHFNSADFALFIGTAIFTFEGIGLLIPIVESMAEPQKFPRVLSITMVLVTFVFTSIGVLSYAAFGEEVESVVLLNLPSGSVMVEAVQFFYAV
ncbi:transmembrane amino acid transporter protein-domain-containing protein, partial [Thamnocephalis sphaerospora]